MHDKSINDYIRRFCDTKNQCFGINTIEKDSIDFAFSGLHSHIKKRLECYDFFTVTKVHKRALTAESRSKESQESHKHHHPNMHALECNSVQVMINLKKFILLSLCGHPKLNHMLFLLLSRLKNNQQEVNFTFDVSMCDRIFDQLYKNGYIKMPHIYRHLRS